MHDLNHTFSSHSISLWHAVSLQWIHRLLTAYLTNCSWLHWLETHAIQCVNLSSCGVTLVGGAKITSQSWKISRTAFRITFAFMYHRFYRLQMTDLKPKIHLGFFWRPTLINLTWNVKDAPWPRQDCVHYEVGSSVYNKTVTPTALHSNVKV